VRQAPWAAGGFPGWTRDRCATWARNSPTAPIPTRDEKKRTHRRRAAGRAPAHPPAATGQPAQGTTSPAKSPVAGDGHTGIGGRPQVPRANRHSGQKWLQSVRYVSR
jgi:hypothetical protein